MARILAVAALALIAAAAVSPPACAQAGAALQGPPDVQIPASFTRRPDDIPIGAVLIGYNAPFGFIFYFPLIIRDVKHGYEVRSASYSLSRVNPNDDTVKLAVSLIRCGPFLQEVPGRKLAPGTPVGTLMPFQSKAAPRKGAAAFHPSRAGEIDAWLAAPISDAEWEQAKKLRYRLQAAVMNEPMATPPNRFGYFEEVIIRAVCSTQPARY